MQFLYDFFGYDLFYQRFRHAYPHFQDDAEQTRQRAGDAGDDSTVTSKPAITHDNGVLFYTDSGKYLHKSEKRETDFHLSPTLTSTETVVFHRGIQRHLYYTDTANSLYIYDLSTFGVLESFAGDFSAISVYDGFIYVVDGDRIRRYSSRRGGVYRLSDLRLLPGKKPPFGRAENRACGGSAPLCR